MSRKRSLYLGISAYYHDSAAALVGEDGIIAAAQEERFSRKRHDSAFPAQAVAFCLKTAGVTIDEVCAVEYYEDSSEKFKRTLSSFASAGPSGLDAFMDVFPSWTQGKRDAKNKISYDLKNFLNVKKLPPIRSHSHHFSHAASTYFPSPFDNAAVLCLDGVGEWHTVSLWHGKGAALNFVNSISYPHSLGLLYSAFTYYCGFKVDSGEYKLMGLAPYGEPKYKQQIRTHLIDLKQDGSFTLNLDYFEFLRGKTMVGDAFSDLFGGPPRPQNSEVRQKDCDLAASIQEVLNEAVLGLVRFAKRETGAQALCLAGGVALNCVSNGEISKSGLFSDLWIQPAAGDAGCALGAALAGFVRDHQKRPGYHFPQNTRKNHQDLMQGCSLGPEFSQAEILKTLETYQAPCKTLEEDALLEEVATHLAQGKVIGWFQGRMEFGPRALGNRSILGDPRNEEMQRIMNLKIKFRESFRPFAPSVLAEDAHQYFDLLHDSPYMLLVSPVKEGLRSKKAADRTLGSIHEVRSSIPAVTHVDFSARIQMVREENNPKYTRLLRKFKEKTGCSLLINTSFNVRGEPIVCSPEEAYLCFMRTGMDTLVLGNSLLLKENQKQLSEEKDWRQAIPLD